MKKLLHPPQPSLGVYMGVFKREDWRGLILFSLTTLTGLIAAIELSTTHRFDLSNKLLSILSPILGFYFGEKTAKRDKK